MSNWMSAHEWLKAYAAHEARELDKRRLYEWLMGHEFDYTERGQA